MEESRRLYGNIRVMPPGTDVLMFRTTLERAQWYVDRGLAAFEADDLLRLNFKPKALGHAGDPYFLQEFKNLCVVCGIDSSLSHHHVVPECYRKYFPRHSQEQGAWMYDVLLLCGGCHKRYEDAAWQKKTDICKEYGVPVSGGADLSNERLRAIKAAAALHRHRQEMPPERRIKLETELQSYLGVEVDPELYGDIHRGLIDGIGYVPMGKMVAEKIVDHDAFAVSWRKHFLRVMKPAHLPGGWVAERRIYFKQDLDA